jgi:DNA (cytosine-5)-methyltransferase 1
VERQRVIELRLKSPQTDERLQLGKPAPSVMARGIGNVFISQHWLEDDGRTDGRTVMPSKPPFRPLTMAQVNAAPLNGLTHVSTFSGGGGTCLGFRLAGFKTLWASDIDAHARQSYSLNLEAPIDGRDIRHVTATDILAATGLQAGELDVFEGSPPCTAFSTAGKRAKGWRQTKDHAGHTQTNVEDLFFEWLRLLDGLRPRAFVAENVAGLVKGVAKGYFKDILRQMKTLGYRTEARLLDAQWLGVPQQRSRIIFIGIREDLKRSPQFPVPWTYQYSVRDALPWIASVKQSVFHGTDRRMTGPNDPCPTVNTAADIGASRGNQYWLETRGGFVRNQDITDSPAPCVQIGGPSAICSTHFIVENGGPSDADTKTGRGIANTERRKFTIAELRRICSFPDDYVMQGSYAQQWARMGNSVPPLMAKAIGEAVRDALLSG